MAEIVFIDQFIEDVIHTLLYFTTSQFKLRRVADMYQLMNFGTFPGNETFLNHTKKPITTNHLKFYYEEETYDIVTA